MAEEIVQDTLENPQNPQGAGDGQGTGDATGTNGGETVTFDEAQQARLDQIIAERLDRERKKWEQRVADEKRRAEEAAEEQRLKEQEEYKALAKKRATKVEELSAQVENLEPEIERYKNALEAQLAAVRDGLPEHILALLDRLDPVEQIEYLADNSEHLRARNGAGVPPSPDPSGDQTVDDAARRRTSARVRNYW